MCELLALSSSYPARLTFSLETLASRGGLAGRSHDGWGVAFYQGPDVALFREPAPAADSALVHFLESQGPPTRLAISHIRHATRGIVSLANTQPFAREMGGRMHTFAHNGDLPGIYDTGLLASGKHRPVGQTDSEHAFCALLEQIAALWQSPVLPSVQARLDVVTEFAQSLRRLGPANFLYADGDALFAHGDRRLQRAGGRAEPPGLWIRHRQCAPAPSTHDQGAGVSVVPEDQVVTWIASLPLTEDTWRPLAEGEVLVVRNGGLLGARLPGAS